MTSKLKFSQEKGYVQYGKIRIRIVPSKEGGTKLENSYGLVRMGIIDMTEIIGLDEQVDLIELRLSHNHITEIKGLENLVSLEELYLNGNQIKEINGLENLTNLRVLDLSSNEIVELGGLKNLTNLQDLNLEGNPIYHTLQQIFGSLTSEEVLNFSHMSTEERYKAIAKGRIEVIPKGRIEVVPKGRIKVKTREVVERDINSVVYNGKILRIEKLTFGKSKLKNIYGLVRMGIIDIAEIIGLEEHIDLIELRLSYNHITEIKGLEHLVNLERLYLNGNRIKKINGLENLTNLRVLDLSSNEIVELGGLENLTNLHVLKLEGNPIYHSLQQIQISGSSTSEKILNFSRMSIEERTVIIRTIEKREVLAKK